MFYGEYVRLRLVTGAVIIGHRYLHTITPLISSVLLLPPLSSGQSPQLIIISLSMIIVSMVADAIIRLQIIIVVVVVSVLSLPVFLHQSLSCQLLLVMQLHLSLSELLMLLLLLLDVPVHVPGRGHLIRESGLVSLARTGAASVDDVTIHVIAELEAGKIWCLI